MNIIFGHIEIYSIGQKTDSEPFFIIAVNLMA